MYIPKNHEIEMHSGVYVDLAKPQAQQILLEDIAFSLSNICRYGGHVRFYNVAQHSVLVAQRLALLGEDIETQLAGLHHDDPEAYIGDIPKPLKPLLPSLKQLNHQFEQAIKEALDLNHLNFDLPCIKAVDNWALSYEAYWLMHSRGQSWETADLYTPGEDSDPGKLSRWSPRIAEAIFLSTHTGLVQ